MTPEETQKSKNGRKNSLGESASSASFNPLLWSKWLYEIRTQLGVRTTKAAAYEDCHEHHVLMASDTVTVIDGRQPIV